MADVFEGRQELELKQHAEPKRLSPSARWPARKALILAIALSLLLWTVLAAGVFMLIRGL